MAKNIVIDTDPGVDDIMAMLLAHKLPELNLRGLTTVAGNVDVEQGTENALKVLKYIGADHIPVAKGFPKPLLRKYENAEGVHGSNGMAGVEIPKPKRGPIDQHAVDFIIESAREYDNFILAGVGPLTNIAIALRKDPGIKDEIERLMIMGGAFHMKGNAAPRSEYNIYTDPEAARMVLESDIPTTIVPLDTTTKVPVKRRVIDNLKEGKTPEAELAHRVLRRFVKQVKKNFGIVPSIHDAVAVYLGTGSRPVETREVPVSVETRGKLTYGETVGEFRTRGRAWQGLVNEHPPEIKVEVCVDADPGEFYGAFVDYLTTEK